MVDPKLWPTKTKEGERDWYVEARVGSENYRGQLVHFIRDWHTPEGRQYVNAKAEDVIAQLLEERDAAIRRLKALDLCTVCAGTGKPVSGKPCICGGHGGIGDQITGLTREAQRAHEKAAQFEADWMAAKYEFGVTLTAERERAENAEALLRESLPHSYPHRHPTDGSDTLTARIREALPK